MTAVTEFTTGGVVQIVHETLVTALCKTPGVALLILFPVAAVFAKPGVIRELSGSSCGYVTLTAVLSCPFCAAPDGRARYQTGITPLCQGSGYLTLLNRGPESL